MSKANRRYVRTIVIGTAALAALVWMAVDQFGIPHEEMLELLLAAGLVVLAVILFAGGATLLWIGLRSVLRRLRGERDAH